MMKVLEDRGLLLLMVLPLVGVPESGLTLAVMFLTTRLPSPMLDLSKLLFALSPTWLLQRPSCTGSVGCPRQGYAVSV